MSARLDLRLDEHLRLADGVLSRAVPDGVVLVDPNSGNAFELNPAGAAVLEVVAAGGALAAGAEALVTRWGISRERAEGDALALGAELLLRGLIVRVPLGNP